MRDGSFQFTNGKKEKGQLISNNAEREDIEKKNIVRETFPSMTSAKTTDNDGRSIGMLMFCSTRFHVARKKSFIESLTYVNMILCNLSEEKEKAKKKLFIIQKDIKGRFFLLSRGDKQYQGKKILNFIVKGLCCSLIHDVMLSKF